MTKLFLLLTVVLFLLKSPMVQAGNPVEKQTVYLSGIDNEHTVAWDFFCTGGRNSGFWTKIQVPSCWEQMGFGTYNYGRDSFNFGDEFEYAKEKGLYRFDFWVPADWKNKEVELVFEGSMTDTEVKINGKVAGATHRGSFYRFSYSITDKLNWGKTNRLEVEVSKWSADSSVNEAERTSDYWIFGGIFRPVYLNVLPRQHIERVAINAEASGSFSMDVFPKNITKLSLVKAEIFNSKGKLVANANIEVKPGDSLRTLKCVVKDPLKWTSETPWLYKVNYTLLEKEIELYRGTEKFGFRTITIKQGDGIYINGTKIKFKGTNRHVWWPETGRTSNRNIDLTDVKLIKEMNMNAVRCSHYPPDKSFLEICDSLGLYVINELAGWQDAYSTFAGAPLVKELVLRDVNHPSIIFWSNGNEGGTNKELDDDYLLYDPSKRPVIHAHHKPGNDFNGIDCNHYENYASTRRILSDSLIYMPTEFLHCQDDGGGAAGLQDFWELMWSSPKSAGGFLWAFIDEGVMRTDLNNIIDVDGVNAEDGVLGPHREKEGSFFAIKEIFTPIKSTGFTLNDNGELTFNVENRFSFTNLSECTFKWKGIKYFNIKDTQHGSKTIFEGTFNLRAAPGEKIIANVTPETQGTDAILLESYDPYGNLILSWVVKCRKAESYIPEIVKLRVTDSIQTTENDSTIIISANKVNFTLSKKTGLLTDIKTDLPNKCNFKNGPVLVTGKAKCVTFKMNPGNDSVTLDFNYEGDLKFIRWTFYNSGWLKLDYSYSLKGTYPFAGVSFDFPEGHMQSVKWLGNGPYRVWKNRPQGGTYNVWENAYNDTKTGYSPWIYPEFKGYFSDVTWMEFKSVEGKFYMVSKQENLFVRLFDFYASYGLKPSPLLPSGNISFLDAIPPVGTKMAVRTDSNAALNGPMGELNRIDSTYNHTLYFYFGWLK